MKRQMSLFVWAVAMFGMSPVLGAVGTASTADLTGGPSVRVTNNINYNKYQTRSSVQKNYSEQDKKDIYYTEPSRRGDLYKQYDTKRNSTRTTNTRNSRVETTRTELKRKYYLAHPFFQPTKGKFGSVTDLSYATSSYDIKLTAREGNSFLLANGGTVSVNNGKWDAKQFAVQEDLSYGITDKFALMLMAKYNSSDYKFDWDTTGGTDKDKDSGLNLFGVGGQWRFVDNTKWIATASAYYQYQRDIANNFVLDLRAGYKVASTTIYGLGRGWYVDIDGNSYGNGVEGSDANGNNVTMLLAYSTDASNIFYIEGGLGVFSVLEEDWTLNLEAVLGHYDWHNQATIKGAIGWQPNSWFALNLYAKTAFYDSSDGKDVEFWTRGVLDQDGVPTGWTRFGTAQLDNYSETSFGVQAIFMF